MSDADARPADTPPDEDLRCLLAWAEAVVGPCRLATGDERSHGRSTVLRLTTAAGEGVYLKRHAERANWANEVHATERWAPAFGGRAPLLLAARDVAPLALLISEAPGTLMRDANLTPAQQLAAWRAAGQALAALHALPVAPQFGFCGRDGAPADPAALTDAVAFVRADLDDWAGGERLARFDDAERRTLAAAHELAAAFSGEAPVACHRDYNPYNWLVAPVSGAAVSGGAVGGAWSGVIDFEFARRDVRLAEFARYPDWEWEQRPELPLALLEGYGRSLGPREQAQLWVARAQYAVAAVTWGAEHAFHGFEAEGHASLACLARTTPA